MSCPAEGDKPFENQAPHHYELGHIALRQLALSDPYGFFDVMGSPLGRQFLEDLWTSVCQNCDKAGTAAFDLNDIIVHRTQVGEFPAVLVVMPTPHFTTEAHMVCVILNVPWDKIQQRPDKVEVRYFTLEKGRSLAAEAGRTVLCEWEGERHINYGDGPEPTISAFLSRVAELV
jgi:hypothetical protein